MFEKEAQVGGKVKSYRHLEEQNAQQSGPMVYDAGAVCIFRTYERVLALLRELGLDHLDQGSVEAFTSTLTPATHSRCSPVTASAAWTRASAFVRVL